MIYRFALTQGAVSTGCGHHMRLIPVATMDTDKYKLRKRRKRTQLRTTYGAMVHTGCGFDCPAQHDRRLKITTYTLPATFRIPGLGFVSVNRQIRSEALPIFYGENTFSFGDTDAIVPFLRDRSFNARQEIRDMEFALDLYYGDDHHFDRQKEWVKAFRYIKWHLNLSKLSVCVLNMTFRWWEPVKFGGRKKEWLRRLAQIDNLDRFEFQMEHAGSEHYVDQMSDYVEDEEDYDAEMVEFYEWRADNEMGYKQYLRTRMIKKKQTSIGKWLQKHVCSTHCRDVKKARAAADGLPKSQANGLWTLPEVDLDALYHSSESDKLDEDVYSDTEDMSDEDSAYEENDEAHS